MAVSPGLPFFPIPFGNVMLPRRRCGVREGRRWHRLCPLGPQYDRFEFEVRTQYRYMPFLADAERLLQVIARDVASGDNQVRDRLRFDDGTQISHSATNGYAIHSSPLQPWI